MYTQHVISMCLKNSARMADMGTRNDMIWKTVKLHQT